MWFSALNTRSEMPPLLSIFASSSGDTASGMRVVRRSGLACLIPLPYHLLHPGHERTRHVGRRPELDMPYHERVGESKLRVIRDGFRFLRVIVETGYRPPPRWSCAR